MKTYPQPDTRADAREFFVVLKDTDRQAFSISGPISDDARLQRMVIERSEATGNPDRWKVSGTTDGPKLAVCVLSEARLSLRGWTFVHDAFAEELQPVRVAENPLSWS